MSSCAGQHPDPRSDLSVCDGEPIHTPGPNGVLLAFRKSDLSVAQVSANFNAYGAAVGARRTELRKFLTAHSDDSTEDEMLGGACETFERFDGWLALTTPSVPATAPL
jgi:light-regulated signal transduction histidine kinase (bacteriophytochrome)